jgi:RNA recognition motif-containing protein
VRDANRIIRDLDLATGVVAAGAVSPGERGRFEPEKANTHRGERAPRIRAALPDRSRRTGRSDRVATLSRPEGNVDGNVYVANLPFSMSSDDLARLFMPFGAVENAAIVTHPKTTRSRGFGFVAMAEAADAINELNGAEVQGRVLTVREARPRT